MVAIPSLVVGRRYVVYCPWNAVDVVERPLRFGPGRELRWVAGAMTLAVGAYFLFGVDVLQRLGHQALVSPAWAWTLLAPAALLAANAAAAFRRTGGLSTEARVDGLGAVMLVALAAVWSGVVSGAPIFALAMLGGLLFALITVARRRRGSAAVP